MLCDRKPRFVLFTTIRKINHPSGQIRRKSNCRSVFFWRFCPLAYSFI